MSKVKRKPKLIFIAESHTFYGGTDVIGVFNSYLKARRAIRKAEPRDYHSISGYRMNSTDYDVCITFRSDGSECERLT